MHARALLPWVTVAVATVVAATAIPAQAAFPGRNGKIVFQTNRDGNAEIYTMTADGTNRVNLTRNPAEDVAPRWSPDGGRIVFASNRTGNFEIYTMQADGSGVTRLTFTTADNGRPSWTADGRILFHTDRDGNREIYGMNADGGGQQNLTQSPSYDAFAAASPEGKKIVFTSDRGGDYHLYLLNAGPVRQLTNTPGAEDFEANWSPHGNDLVFVRFDSSFANSELYTMHADGSGLTQLTNTPGRTEFEPAWSPDGKKIVFHSCTGLNTADQSDDHCVNSVINADGSGETEITRTPQAPFVETFDSGVLDSSYWYTIADSGGSVGLVNGRLEEFISHDADPTLHNFNQVDEQLGFQCRLNGDFDYQADYTLVNWPAHNGFFDSLNAIFGGGSISRMSTPSMRRTTSRTAHGRILRRSASAGSTPRTEAARCASCGRRASCTGTPAAARRSTGR
jgi:Tol biopolymer transport system component